MQVAPPSGPHVLGFDVIWIATILSAVAAFAVLLAILAVLCVAGSILKQM